jgi:LPS export ABC transporter permease LptG/LPS export ABC transporter permease LptF
MRQIDRLLYFAIIPPFLIALGVLTFIALIHDLGNLSELLISRNASLATILTIAGTILPAVLVFSLPLSYLTGILIGLSGLSGESQITALRACGVPMRRLLGFVATLGIVVGTVTGALSTLLLPRTNDILQQVKDSIKLTYATSQIQPRVFNEGFPYIVFYVDDLALDRQHWERVFLADYSDPKAPRTIMARTGTWITDPANRRLQLHLEHGVIYATDTADPSKDSISAFAATDIPIDLTVLFRAQEEARNRPKKAVEQSTSFLWQKYRSSPPAEKLEQIVELNRRIALPFSVFPFALLGLTLAVGTPRGGRTSGFALSLIAVLAFYILFFNGIRLASVGKINPLLGVWGANILLAGMGLLLLIKVERNFRLGSWIGGLLWKTRLDALSRRLQLEKAARRVSRVDRAVLKSTSGLARYLSPKVFDLYISRGFFSYFLWSFIACGTLFVLLTLFDLLDDIIRHRIPVMVVLDYFTFLTPQIVMLVIPMSTLLAILINFGIMEKNSEVTAIKAGGWSLHRISLPVFLVGSALCIGLFLMQDYVLPYANDRQDSLRNIIKGRPPQTTMRLQRKWIFGESDRIYNYEYFDGNQDSFVDLNVYDVDFDSVKVVRRIHAARARIDRQGLWGLEDGWIRDFHSPQAGFTRIKSHTFNFPEKAGYFEKEIFQPRESSKLTYGELKNYISYLQKSGYNATELRVELNKKIALPLSCLVMVLLGIPFSFSTGKKGAFFGIGISIAIAMMYWGISGVFDAMGAYGLLVPILAAWAPNILFGAAGIVLLLNVRT